MINIWPWLFRTMSTWRAGLLRRVWDRTGVSVSTGFLLEIPMRGFLGNVKPSANNNNDMCCFLKQ